MKNTFGLILVFILSSFSVSSQDLNDEKSLRLEELNSYWTHLKR